MTETNSETNIFNSALECGLRVLVLLEAASPSMYDLQRLVFYDYLLVHSGDVSNGPDSIHPATPLRSGEALVRRHWVERGLLLMASRQLINRHFSPEGLLYQASPLAGPFLTYMQQPYTLLLRERATWVDSTFRSYSDSDLTQFFRSNIGRWGGEFIREGQVEEEF
jgi:hypothetical protein